MITINLLPWRQQRRDQEKKRFIILLALGIVIAAFSIFLINSYVSHLGTVQVTRNGSLREEILYLDDEIKEIKSLKQNRETILSRMLLVQNLQNSKILM